MKKDNNNPHRDLMDYVLAVVKNNNGSTSAEICQSCRDLDRCQTSTILSLLLDEGQITTGSIRECAVLGTPFKTFWKN
ncbi:hypothetical protein [Sansalvadorimonas verongulae]|uniref:hypothetical protein n=1 Tax=Sansalvadorimonas verongulae TaxID=2172824 RepID=UPI0012BCFB1D|nr:hypothetical protein [Sansalvadorimonas verongulae]MTI12006.1 hypothetical protein [Sansalvadorimonas verongulae]